jgi:CRISPR-associated protein Cmr4
VDVTHYLLYLYAESPVHTGAADSAGVIDLPVQREAATKYPVIWGQSLKGALRQAAVDAGWGDRVIKVFGSEPGAAGESSQTSPGTLAVGDAQLVAMPVPTLRRTFAWVTSTVALSRLARKYRVLGRDTDELPRVASDAAVAVPVEVAGQPKAAAGATAASSASYGWSGIEVIGPCLVPFRAASPELATWADRIATDVLGWDDVFAPFADKLRVDLLTVGEELVSVLLAECTEQSVRVQLNASKKTVEKGPFYTEYLPTETILAASLTLRGEGDTPEDRAALTGLFDKKLAQIGGDETIGKGLVWCRLLEGSE